MAKIVPSTLQSVQQVVNTIQRYIAQYGSIKIPGNVSNSKSSHDLISYFFSYIYCGGVYHPIEGCYISDVANKIGLSNGNLQNNAARSVPCDQNIEPQLTSIMQALQQIGYITKSTNNMVLTTHGRSIIA